MTSAPAWAEQVAHAGKRRTGIHVVQRGDGGDEVERGGLEGKGQEVAKEVLDIGAGLFAREGDALRVGARWRRHRG